MFGKDSRILDTLGSFGATGKTEQGTFRQNSGKFGRTRFEKKDKSGVPYFINAYRPSIGALDTVRLVAGEYPSEEVIKGSDDQLVTQAVVLPYIYFTDHYDGKTRKSCICSGGPFANYKERRAPCHGCDIFWETVQRNSQGRLESSRMSRQTKYALGVLDYGAYHKTPQEDFNTGEVKINQVTKEPYFNWTKCQGEACDYCRVGLEWKYGDNRHWPMTYTDFQILRDAAAKIERSCTTCQQKDCIKSRAWVCKSCGDAVIDMDTTALKKEEILKMQEDEVKCPHCSSFGFLSEVYECTVCARQGKQGVRASLFDVDLQVQIVELPGDKKMLQVVGWSAPYPAALNPLVCGDPNNPQMKGNPDLLKPVPLQDIFKPAPLSLQATRFGLSSAPQAHATPNSTGSPPARPYGFILPTLPGHR